MQFGSMKYTILYLLYNGKYFRIQEQHNGNYILHRSMCSISHRWSSLLCRLRTKRSFSNLMATTIEEFLALHTTPRPCKRVPTSKPPFTLSQLKKAIPPHCFRRSLPRSLMYLHADLALCTALVYIAIFYLPYIPAPYAYISWPLMYWIPQGLTFAGLWILGHELGHHAFSDYQLLDDTLGFIIHSALMVPYYSWKFSHRRHHSNTGSLERDEVFVPQLKSSLPWFASYLDNPLGRFIYISLCLTVGWPLYLAINASGRNYPRFTSHFDPYGPLFTDNQHHLIFASDAGILAVCYALYRLSVAYSFTWVFMMYGVPLIIMGGCLVLITFLQHTHVELPHYDSEEWDWLRGALSTVDRDYGKIMNWRFHNCGTTHIVHHLFPTLPHYHGKEATKALKAALGDYYKFDSTPVLKAIWREAKECLYVEEERGRKGVFWYNNKL